MLEVNYVSAVQATLRDQVATIYNRVGTVKNGERVEVLEHEKRFARVRTASGVEGWIEQRYLVDQTNLRRSAEADERQPERSRASARGAAQRHESAPHARP